MKDLIVRIGRFVLVSELVATALLTIGFISDGDHSVVRSLHLAVFHAVSAFNNAGFSILDGGLERYVENWYMNLVVAGTFILGGLGFPVVFELRRAWRQPRRWTLHTKVTMTTTAVLLVGGTLLVAASEWQGSALDGLGTADRMLASFFQSATARTAGFNTLPIADLEPSTWLVLILLMVIGAGSASTGGGIKVTTWAVVVRSTMSEFRRDKATTMFSRSIPLELQRKSLALVTAALATVGTTTFLLTATHENIPIAELLFEAASAFGTVGVSTGVTDQLSTFGRLLIIALMFIGRVGPITFGTAVLLRRQRPLYSYADESLIVG